MTEVCLSSRRVGAPSDAEICDSVSVYVTPDVGPRPNYGSDPFLQDKGFSRPPWTLELVSTSASPRPNRATQELIPHIPSATGWTSMLRSISFYVSAYLLLALCALSSPITRSIPDADLIRRDQCVVNRGYCGMPLDLSKSTPVGSLLTAFGVCVINASVFTIVHTLCTQQEGQHCCSPRLSRGSVLQ